MEPRHEQPAASPQTVRPGETVRPGAPAHEVETDLTHGNGARHAAGSVAPEPRSIPHLLRQLTDQVTTLFTKEMALARSEVRHAVSQAKTGVGSVAVGALVTFGGFLVLLFAAVYALALVLSAWLSALIVGLVTVVIGAIMLNVGKNRLEPSAFKPERTAEQLRRDKSLAQSELEHGGSR